MKLFSHYRNSLLVVVTLSLILLFSSIATANDFMQKPIKSSIQSEDTINVFYPNGDWGLTPVKLSVPSDIENKYLFALQQLIEPNYLPAGCYDEFPSEFQIYDISIKDDTAYIVVNDVALKNSSISSSWITTLGDIVAYNVFKFDSKIEAVGFLSDGKASIMLNMTQKDIIFAVPETKPATDMTLDLDIDVNELKGMTTEEINEAIQQVIKSAVGTSSKSSYIICIDPGHGGSDPGATQGSIYEKNLNLNIALATQTYLNSVSFPTFTALMTRTTDKTVDLTDRHELANNNNADIFISIHCNTFTNPSTRGCTARYPNNHDVSQSQSLSNALISGITNFSTIPKHSDATYQSIQVIRNTQMPASLVECGFMTNSTDLTALQNEDYDIGRGIGASANFWCQVSI